MQDFVQEASYDSFIVKKEYKKLLPRPSYIERLSIELSMLELGQLNPITVNSEMVVLDGHERLDILANKGLRVKYTVIQPVDERRYIIESNVMRRQLTSFQKLESLYEFYNEQRAERRLKDFTSRYDMIQAVKDGAITAVEVAKETHYNEKVCVDILKELAEDYYVSRRKEKKVNVGKSGATSMYVYSMMPKGEEALIKRKDKPSGSVGLIVGKITGISRTTVEYGMRLIEEADEPTKKKLRNGTTTIGFEHRKFALPSTSRNLQSMWGKNSKIQCPHCNHIAPKKEYKMV